MTKTHPNQSRRRGKKWQTRSNTSGSTPYLPCHRNRGMKVADFPYIRALCTKSPARCNRKGKIRLRYKPHNPQYLDSLWRRANVPNVSFLISQFTVANLPHQLSLLNPNFLAFFARRTLLFSWWFLDRKAKYWGAQYGDKNIVVFSCWL